jgi:hypothetical protein
MLRAYSCARIERVATAAVTMQTIRTPEKEIVLTEALREKPSIKAACRKARIGRNAFYNWFNDDPEFAARINAAKAQGLDALEDALTERGLITDTTAAIFLLKSHRPEIYRDRIDLNVQVRKKAEQMADALGIPADDLISEAEAIAAGTWDAWSPPSP